MGWRSKMNFRIIALGFVWQFTQVQGIWIPQKVIFNLEWFR
jgi:hypothetical protein